MPILYNKDRKNGLFYIPSGGLGPSVSADFSYSKSSYNQGEADPTPTITGTAGGTFNADAGVVFVDTGSFNSSTGQIDLSATTIDSHIITYTVDGVQSGQTVGVTAIPYQSTSSFIFDGIDSYFNASISALDNANALTFSGWVKKTAGNVVGFESFVSSTDRAILYWWSDNNIYWSVRNGSSSTAASYSLTLYDWNHIAGTFDGATNTIKLYVNGSLVNTQTGQPSNTSANLSNNFHIGLSNGSTYSNGNIDEVSIWNTALSSDAVTEIFNEQPSGSGKPNNLESLTNASSSNLKAWYKMGE